jgi:hypothetical protein
VVVLIAPKARVGGLVHERQVDLGEVDELDVECCVCAGTLGEPLGDRHAGTAGASAGNHDG